MDLVIRAATYEDISLLLLLLEQLFAIEEDYQCDEMKQRKGLELLLRMGNAAVLVAEVERKIVGMVTSQLVISTAEGTNSLLVEDVVVDSGWRGKGIGTKLLGAVSLWGREQGACRHQLLADKGNRQALEFYSKIGWKQTNLICLRQRCRSHEYESCPNR